MEDIDRSTLTGGAVLANHPDSSYLFFLLLLLLLRLRSPITDPRAAARERAPLAADNLAAMPDAAAAACSTPRYFSAAARGPGRHCTLAAAEAVRRCVTPMLAMRAVAARCLPRAPQAPPRECRARCAHTCTSARSVRQHPYCTAARCMASPRRSVSFRTSRIAGAWGVRRCRPTAATCLDEPGLLRSQEPAKPSDTSAAADAELAEAQQEEVVHQEINVRAGAPQQPPLSQAAMAAAAAQEATPLPEHIKPEDMAKFYSLLNQPNWDGVQQRVGELVQAEQLDERVLEAALLVLNAAFERKESVRATAAAIASLAPCDARPCSMTV
eukprot:scaffold1789_cov375-Prasinococcus_capsulatus_cf.AAC.21